VKRHGEKIAKRQGLPHSWGTITIKKKQGGGEIRDLQKDPDGIYHGRGPESRG